jgi:3-oxoacyl-[acyl-carrier protein] reductase
MSNQIIKPRKVLVTGASRGIGRAIAAEYSQRGYEVVTPTRNELDLSSIDSVRDYASKYLSDIDILINNAGENIVGTIEQVSYTEFMQVLNVNLISAFLLIQSTAGHMRSQGWGRILNVSSCYSIVSRAGRGPYSAAKSGLNGLTRTVALELASSNVLVNAICPGFVETELTKRNNSSEQIDALVRQIPMGRLAQPDEIAHFAYHLASAENSYITGQIIALDGGFLCQ